MDHRQQRRSDGGEVEQPQEPRICRLCGHLEGPGHDCVQVSGVVDGHLPRVTRMDGEA